MPLFEFRCQNCGQVFELLVRNQERPVCPGCATDRLEKLMSAAAGRLSGGSLPLAGGACPPPSAHPCGPGCCRLP